MKKQEDDRTVWKKEGGGSFRIGKRIIKPGQIFRAYPHEIPQVFRDVVKPLSEIPDEELAPVATETASYIPKHRGGGWYDVVNEKTGKVMSEKALKIDAAKKLISELEK